MHNTSEHGDGAKDTPMPPTKSLDEIATAEMLAIEKECISTLPDVETLELPAIDVAQLPTLKLEMRVVPGPTRPLLLLVEDNPFFDRATLILPALPKQGKEGQQLDEAKKNQIGAETQSYLSPVLDMLKSSGIYALGAFVSPLVSLIITPFLTKHLSNTNYGGLAVLYTVVDLVTIITQVGLVPAFFRAYNGDYESPRDRLSVLAVTIILLLFIAGPLVFVMILAAPWISEFLFNTPAFSESVKFTALVIVLENLTVPGISWLRAEKRATLFSLLSIANLLFSLGANFILVGAFHLGVNGALLAKGSGYAVAVICTLPPLLFFLIRKRGLHLRLTIVRSMLFFGVPTIFSDMAAWVLQLSDRYLLSHFGSLSQTASYTVAYTLGGVLSPLVLSPFGLAWTPMMYTIAKRKDAAHIFQLIFRWFSIILFFSAFALSLVSTLVLELFFPSSYHSAELVIPIIALSMAFVGAWYIFMTGVYISRKTIFEFFFMLIAASLNVLLNIFAIPSFGAIGAAFSTLLSYGVLLVVSYIVNQRIYPIKFEIGAFILRLIVGVALYMGCNFLIRVQTPEMHWGICIGTLALYGIFLVLHGGLSYKKMKKLGSFLKTNLQKKRENKSHA